MGWGSDKCPGAENAGWLILNRFLKSEDLLGFCKNFRAVRHCYTEAAYSFIMQLKFISEVNSLI